MSVAEEDPELVLRWRVVVVIVVVAVEAKLRLWRSSAKSSGHGSIEQF